MTSPHSLSKLRLSFHLLQDLTCEKGRLTEIPKGRPWTIPREGACVIAFRASRFPGDMIHVESAEGLAAMVENIRHVSGIKASSLKG